MQAIWQSVSTVIPIIFVLAFGYIAGRHQAFGPGPEPVRTINKLVLTYALPPSLYVGTVTVSRAKLISEFSIFIALFIALIGGFLLAFMIARFMFKRSMTASSLQALAIGFSAGPFYGPALLGSIYGETSGVAVSMVSMVLNVFMIPIATVLIKIEAQQTATAGQRGASDAPQSTFAIIGKSLNHAIFKTPFVWAPLLGFAMVLAEIPSPDILNNSFELIGKATAGVAVFVCGLTLANYELALGKEIWLNVAAKNIVVPLLFVGVALLIGMKLDSANFGQGLILAALPTGPMAVLLATEYKTYQRRASATLALSTIAMIVTVTAAVLLVQA